MTSIDLTLQKPDLEDKAIDIEPSSTELNAASRDLSHLKHVTRGESILYRPRDEGSILITQIELTKLTVDDPTKLVQDVFDNAKPFMCYSKVCLTRTMDDGIMIWCLTRSPKKMKPVTVAESPIDPATLLHLLLDQISSVCTPNISRFDYVAGTDSIFGEGSALYVDTLHLKRGMDKELFVNMIKSSHIIMRSEFESSVSFLCCHDPKRLAFCIVYCAQSQADWQAYLGSGVYKDIRSKLHPFRAGPQSISTLKLTKTFSHNSDDVPAILPGTPCAKKVPRSMTLDFGAMPTADTSPAKVVVDEAEVSPTSRELQIELPQLKQHLDFIKFRFTSIKTRETTLTGGERSLLDFARDSYMFGCFEATDVNNSKGVMFRDWIPGATNALLRGSFSDWTDIPLQSDDAYGPYCFSRFLPYEGLYSISEGDKFQLRFLVGEGYEDMVPAYAKQVVSEDETSYSNACVLLQDYSDYHGAQLDPVDKDFVPLIYEAHIGVSGAENKIGTYNSFVRDVLPMVLHGGYNTLCLLGITNHLTYSTFGWHPTNYYAPTSIFGSPEELHKLINTCHELNIRVVLSVIHGHAGPVKGVGLESYGYGGDGYLQTGGIESVCTALDAKKFAYGKKEVARYLLGSLVHWAEVYKIDGFRFENAASMLYTHQGNCVDLATLTDRAHFGPEADVEGHAYLGICAMICKQLKVMSIIHTNSSMPGMLETIERGGLGFDFQSCSHYSNIVRRFLVSSTDENLRVSDLAATVPLLNGDRIIHCLSNWDSNLIAKRPMKIALFSWETLHTLSVGGVAPHVTELAAGLARLGHEVHVFTRSTTTTASHHVQYGVHYHECPMGLDRDFVKEIGNMCNSLQFHMQEIEGYMNDKFAICHAHDWLAAKCLGFTKADGHTSVLTMHSTEYGRCGNNSYAGQSVQVRDIERYGCDIADRVITVSGVLADEVKSLYDVHPEKIRVVYNGITAQNWDTDIDIGAVKGNYGISPMAPTFVFVGRMAVQKGPDLLVDAMPEIVACRGDTVFVMVGNGHLFEELRKKTDKMGLANNVRWLGSKGGSELQSIIKMADAVVVPSRNEPFGIVVLEAWACHKPVVATTCGGPRCFVTDEVEGYLVDPVPGSVAYGCKRILENFDHAQWMGERGRVKAAYNFTWDIVASQTRDVYQELTAHHDAPYGLNQLYVKYGEQTLIHKLIGPVIYTDMGVMNDSVEVTRGIMLYNLLKLYVCSVSRGGYTSWMGSEFGHPTMIDLPRPGNNFSQRHGYVRWDLYREGSLKFKHIGLFDASLMALFNVLKFSGITATVQYECNFTKLLIIDKGDNTSIILNFHPTQTYNDVKVGRKSKAPIRFSWNSHQVKFGAHCDLPSEYSDLRDVGANGLPYSLDLYQVKPRSGYVISTSQVVLKPGSALLVECADQFLRQLEM